MNYGQINELINRSLLEIFYKDHLLLERNVREECLNHRLAFYLEVLFGQIINDDMLCSVDLEYNKNISIENKQIIIGNNTPLSIRPDIIIHKREDNDSNLLAVEAKLHKLTSHDILKLNKLLLPPYSYHYSVGVVYFPQKQYFKYKLFWIEEGVVRLCVVKIKKE